MKNSKKLLILLLIIGLSLTAFSLTVSARGEDDIIPIYEGSEIIYDDLFGFEEIPVILNETSVILQEGNLRRLWCQAPEGRSPYEIIRNFESAIENIEGQIIFSTREPQSLEIDEKNLSDYFKVNRQDRGLATHVFSYTHFPGEMSEYLVGKVRTGERDSYVIVASGRGHWAANQSDNTYYEVITLELEAMEMDMVTMEALHQGLAVQGRIAIYNILFDTGESRVKAESAEALITIADFLKDNPSQRYLVVGHTDSMGGYDMNLRLSEARAEAVVAELINVYGITQEQLIPVGVGPASPVMSNTTEEGRARNRRVEIVEL